MKNYKKEGNYNINLYLIFLIIFGIVLISGCTTTTSQKETNAVTVNPAQNESVIVVQRTSRMLSAFVSMKIWVNNEEAAKVRNGRQKQIIIPNGEYAIYASMENNKIGNEIKFSVYNEVIFISAVPQWSTRPELTQIGKRNLGNLQQNIFNDSINAAVSTQHQYNNISRSQIKYALVIGNSNYTHFGTLRNSGNDANDMGSVLRELGFNVNVILDGSLIQMEDAAIGLRNSLSTAGNDSIGLFYFAGHGLEMNGVNYLIPANANIPDRNFLRERAFSVQIMLDMLNESRNSLNIIVLDACRDFPAVWSRSLNRGLAFITNPPANHIIMFATGAGQVASDGIGRNGLFTTHLLNNLRQPDDINEIFRKTMLDVSDASRNEQRPALYTDFGRNLFLK